MFIRYIFIVLLLPAFSCLAHATDKHDVVIYTEHYPPFNYLDESGEVVGDATHNVRQIMNATGLSYKIQLLPWARALKGVENNDNSLIYTITRTPKRGPKFDWLVPIAKTNYYLFVRADDMRPVTLEALKAGDFTASCVSNDLGCELLKWTGMPEQNIIPVSREGTGDFRMVVAKRADIYISDLATNDSLRRSEGYDPSLTKPAMPLGGDTGFYLASNLKMNPEIRHKIRRTYETLENSGQYKMVEPPLRKQ